MSDLNQHQVDEIDSLLRDNVAELVTHIQGKPGKRHGNEMRWGHKGGLSVMIGGCDKGRITRFDGDGCGRSPLKFIMEEYGYSFQQALDWAANWLGLSPSYKPDPDAERYRKEKSEQCQRESENSQKLEQAQRIAKATALAKQSVDTKGTPAEAYLAGRGITPPFLDDIRFLVSQSGEHDALLAVARDNAGNVRAVQRIFIDGDKKASIETVKRTNGVMDGAAVRLPASCGEELVLAEGPETGLSVWQAWGRETWIALGGIAKLVNVVPTDRPIVITRDADAPNSQADLALNKAVASMIERGVSVRVASPPNPTKIGYDFNDALVEYGNDTVASTLATGGYIKPRYPKQSATVQECRKTVLEVFAAWRGTLSDFWREKAEYDAYLLDVQMQALASDGYTV